MRLLLLLVMTVQDNRQGRGNDTANSLRQPQTEYQTETQTQGMQYGLPQPGELCDLHVFISYCGLTFCVLKVLNGFVFICFERLILLCKLLTVFCFMKIFCQIIFP